MVWLLITATRDQWQERARRCRDPLAHSVTNCCKTFQPGPRGHHIRVCRRPRGDAAGREAATLGEDAALVARPAAVDRFLDLGVKLRPSTTAGPMLRAYNAEADNLVRG